MDTKMYMREVLSPEEYKLWLTGFEDANPCLDVKKQQPKKDMPEFQSVSN